MPGLEELLYTLATQDVDMIAKLAKFKAKPAFFERQAPGDTDQGWTGSQYPRMDYIIDRTEDPERKVSGVAVFNIWCRADQGSGPEDIETRTRTILDGAVFHPEGEPVTVMKWNRSEPFESTGENEILIIGYTVAFDLLAFPVQETAAEPDPIKALNKWIVDTFNTLQADPNAWAPTDNAPAIYWRMSGIQFAELWNSCSWYDMQVAGHVMAPTPAGRLPWIKAITEKLALEGVLKAGDGSPLFIRQVGADSQRDHLRVGQINTTIRYGVLPATAPVEPLNNPIINKP